MLDYCLYNQSIDMGKNGYRTIPPSLTSAELKEIQRTDRSPNVRRLLWEVFRLRAIAMRADQLIRSIIADPASLEFNSAEIVVKELRASLDELPLMRERGKEREELLFPGGKKRKGIGEK